MRKRQNGKRVSAPVTKKIQPVSATSSPPEENVIHFKFGNEVLALTPSAEAPIHVLLTETYETWIDSVIDMKTNARITSQVDKIRRGLFGDWKDVGQNVCELRLDFGPGYRIYYAKYGKVIVILLGGGDKSTQQKDITDAQQLWGGLKMKLRKFEDHLHEKLRDPDYAVAYLETTLEDGGIEEFLHAVREVAVAQSGIQQVAKASRHGRESLYKSLSKQGNPRVKTLDDILHVLGMRIAVTRSAAPQMQAEIGHAQASA